MTHPSSVALGQLVDVEYKIWKLEGLLWIRTDCFLYLNLERKVYILLYIY